MEDNNKKNKKIIILVGVIISIIGICIAIPNYMKYIKTQKEISDANNSYDYYATNPTETTTEEQTTEIIDTSQTTEESSTTEVEYEIPDFTFNVPEDVNSDRTDIDWTNISIDGEMVSFPCTYNVLKQTYGTLYETKSINKFGEEQLVEVNPNEVGKVTKYLVRVLPKTGTGIIYFYFTSDTETELTNCMCTGVYVSSMSTENKPLIAVTLRGGVHFGSTADEILDPNAYEKVTTSYTNKNGSFEIYYKKLGYELKFYGVDKGLYSFEFDFNAYEKN